MHNTLPGKNQHREVKHLQQTEGSLQEICSKQPGGTTKAPTPLRN